MEEIITPFSVKSGTPKTPKRYNCTQKSVIILDRFTLKLCLKMDS